MRRLVLAGLVMLSGCGSGGTTGTNYSDPPPMATIVATPSPRTTPTPEAETEAVVNASDAAADAGAAPADNAEAPADNAM